MVEAVGESFTKAARVSTTTGMPTILGWPGHEQLWRNDYLAVGIRRAAVEEIYSGPDPDIRCNLISRFRVRYVVVGQFEYSLYPELDAVALSELGSKIIETDAGYVIMVNDKGCGE